MTVVDCLRGFLGRSNQCWHSLQLEFGNIIVNKDLKRGIMKKIPSIILWLIILFLVVTISLYWDLGSLKGLIQSNYIIKCTLP